MYTIQANLTEEQFKEILSMGVEVSSVVLNSLVETVKETPPTKQIVETFRGGHVPTIKGVPSEKVGETWRMVISKWVELNRENSEPAQSKFREGINREYKIDITKNMWAKMVNFKSYAQYWEEWNIKTLIDELFDVRSYTPKQKQNYLNECAKHNITPRKF